VNQGQADAVLRAIHDFPERKALKNVVVPPEVVSQLRSPLQLEKVY
jgi:hypothetical protein